eukprot:TRINITY_DN8844_c0_g1_i3.p1 TRINITY_DN8844_c0_g1~~TRINITY_DN8844_c0_g1_i3.p1  ORF type:complete len:463 (-),score=70.52 TRINITY_DN8844_c0_g1_i3:97-1485(-)
MLSIKPSFVSRNRNTNIYKTSKIRNQISQNSSVNEPLYLGIDFGTSGARAIVINDRDEICTEKQVGYSSKIDLAQGWRIALFQLLGSIDNGMKSNIQSIAFDGTSATCMLIDKITGQILTQPKLYNESQSKQSVDFVKSIAPESHTTVSSTSSLCKLVAWHQDNVWQKLQNEGAQVMLISQSDWAASLLHGIRDCSDYNNVLKLGYDPAAEQYPDWLATQPFAHLLPTKILPPASVLAKVTASAAQSSGLNTSCYVCSGTTDSIAAFIAAGVSEVGEAVTSLGSTLAIKMLSETRIDDANYGIYSHRLGDSWLVGGASNTGGAVLKKFFDNDELQELSTKINGDKPSPLDYYPLACPGERFPINDPHLQPLLEPRPEDDAEFLHAMLQGIAKIENMGYQLLMQLGASKLKKVYTAGGGAKNGVWNQIRQKLLNVDVIASPQAEAAYGAAILAKQGAKSVTQN